MLEFNDDRFMFGWINSVLQLAYRTVIFCNLLIVVCIPDGYGGSILFASRARFLTFVF
jgi:hypothetical protein